MLGIFRLLFFLLIIFNSISLNAVVYHDDVLNIFSKISPRFVLMSNQKEKLKSKINICILHEDIDEQTASLLVKKTKEYYPNGIKNYQLKFTNTSYSNIDSCQDAHLLFLFNVDKNELMKAIELSNKNKILTISYDKKLLDYGVDISLFVGRKIIPYININSINSKSWDPFPISIIKLSNNYYK